MSDVTRLLDDAAAGDPKAAEKLLPLVYDELRKLAAARMTAESADHTLQPTALVHEAYLRLIKGNQPHEWSGRGHFFYAASEAMRRILVEAARRKSRVRHGGTARRVELKDFPAAAPPEDLIAVDEALERLAVRDPARAELVKLRFFGGLTVPEAATVMGISVATAERHWTFARAWLYAELNPSEENSTFS